MKKLISILLASALVCQSSLTMAVSLPSIPQISLSNPLRKQKAEKPVILASDEKPQLHKKKKPKRSVVSMLSSAGSTLAVLPSRMAKGIAKACNENFYYPTYEMFVLKQYLMSEQGKRHIKAAIFYGVSAICFFGSVKYLAYKQQVILDGQRLIFEQQNNFLQEIEQWDQKSQKNSQLIIQKIKGDVGTQLNQLSQQVKKGVKQELNEAETQIKDDMTQLEKGVSGSITQLSKDIKNKTGFRGITVVEQGCQHVENKFQDMCRKQKIGTWTQEAREIKDRYRMPNYVDLERATMIFDGKGDEYLCVEAHVKPGWSSETLDKQWAPKKKIIEDDLAKKFAVPSNRVIVVGYDPKAKTWLQ